jgi:hypothetical protein
VVQVSVTDEQNEELYAVAAEHGWQLERVPEDKARPWRRIYIARRNGRSLYGDAHDLVKRMSAPEHNKPTKESNMAKSDHLVEEFAPAPRGGYSDSQSPRAHRSTTNDVDAFAKGENLDGIRPMRKEGGEPNADAWDNTSALDIERVNRRADRV